jgi:LysR family transcriptional regulator, regulator of abg operon
MKLHALQAFVTAIDSGSLRKAAVQLNTSQPALTKLVRELEQTVGSVLLVRKSQGVSPTDAGRILYEHALQALRTLDVAQGHIRQLAGDMRGELIISAVPVAMMLLIPEAVRSFGRAHPDMVLQLSETLYVEPLQQLRADEVDVVVGGIPKNLANGEFRVEPLMRTTMVVVADKNSPHARAKHLSQLTEAPWIFTGNSPQTGYAAQLFAAHGLPVPPMGAMVNSTLTLMSLLGSGHLVGLMPEQLLSHPGLGAQLVPVRIKEQGIELTIGAMIRNESAQRPGVQKLINHLHRAAHHLKQSAKSL